MSRVDRYLTLNQRGMHPVFDWLERETHFRTNHLRMLCGPQVARLLTTFCELLSPNNVLELGSFTGYSSVAIALGLKAGSILDTVELNDEHEGLIREALSRAGVEDRVNLIIGDALMVIPTLGKMYDLVYIDANKRDYPLYYELIMEVLRPGGYIIADNVLWDGKVYLDDPPNDKQTSAIIRFNKMVAEDSRVENYILNIRDGLNIIKRLV